MMQFQFMSQYWNQAAGVTAGKHSGWVKSINTEKGFGFISCPQTYAQFQRDVFARGQDLQGLEQGQYVTFTVSTNKNGLPQANDVQASTEPTPTKGKGKGGGKDGKGKDGKGKDGKGKDGKGKGKDKDKGKDGKKGKGKEGKGSASTEK